MNNGFKGYYFKHQKDEQILAFVVGCSHSEEFIQIITKNASYHLPFIEHNQFSKKGVKININTNSINLVGEVKYTDFTPIRYDIMGPFKFFPMECRHGIVSMHHKLKGHFLLNGEKLDFTDGVGYIECDSGRSFPKNYTWIQCNDFPGKCSVMASVADIPFMGTHFQGCISVVLYNDKEYRLATYLGVKVERCTKEEIILKQGKYKLHINMSSTEGYQLNAPQNGEMIRTIIETPACPARFRFFQDSHLLFDYRSNMASFEYEWDK